MPQGVWARRVKKGTFVRSTAPSQNWVGRVLGVLLLVAGAATPCLPARAGEPGTSTCTFTGGEVLVDLQEEDSSGILSRNAVGAILYDPESDPPVVPAPCGGATTATTTLIKIQDTSNDKSTGIILDVSSGPFANGGTESPIKVDLARGPLDTFGVVGAPDANFFTFGFKDGNLQKDSNAEIAFVSPPDFGFGTGEGGDDHVCSAGGRGTGGASQIGWVFAGGKGADTVCGGRTTDRILGNGGRDTLRGNGGGDTLKGNDGKDRISGNASSDLLIGGPGADFLNGGAGFDGCNGGSGGDRKKRCEG